MTSCIIKLLTKLTKVYLAEYLYDSQSNWHPGEVCQTSCQGVQDYVDLFMMKTAGLFWYFCFVMR